MARVLQLRHLPGTSPLHRVRSDIKILSLMSCTTVVALNPGWGPLAAGWSLAVVLFLIARLPRRILAPPPRPLLLVLGFSFLFSLLSGGDPVVAGIEVGGVVELAQLVALGFLLIGLAALLTWTTSLTEIGLGLGRLLRPFRLLRLPVDELTTTIVLAVRALPLVRDELATSIDARRTRPTPAQQRNGFRAAVNEAFDVGATVVVGAHRRSHEMARAMVARNSSVAPSSPAPRLGLADAVGLLVAAGWTAAVAVLL